MKGQRYRMPLLVKTTMLTVAICFFLLVLNICIYFQMSPKVIREGKVYVSIWNKYERSPRTTVQLFTKHLEETGRISKKDQEYIDRHNLFAMLLNENGEIEWQQNLPKELKKNYSLTDFVSMSRAYLMDYPVFLWTMGDKVFILGYPKGSIWKYQMVYPTSQLNIFIRWIPMVIFINTLVAFLVSSFVEWEQRKRYKKQEQKDEARAQWIRAISHDIRTPLTLILGNADSIATSQTAQDTTKREAEIIKAQAMRIQQLVSDLNLTMKLEYHMQPMKWEEIQVAPMLRKLVVDLLNEGLLENYSIDLSLPEEAEMWLIKGDRSLIERALYNIIQNCVKHNKMGCEIFVSAKIKGNMLCLLVEDNGSKEVDFDALDHAQGLGLRIVRNVLKVHKGKTYFYKKSPRGFGVELLFPQCFQIKSRKGKRKE